MSSISLLRIIWLFELPLLRPVMLFGVGERRQKGGHLEASPEQDRNGSI